MNILGIHGCVTINQHDDAGAAVAFNVKSPWNSLLKSTIHVNNTGRVQTINKIVDSSFYNLINEVKYRTGCPPVLNTSFNIIGQPIVEKSLEAISIFYGTGLDSLLLGKYLITR
jgi:carbamoyltransferase